jgi:hydrogenase-4 component E
MEMPDLLNAVLVVVLVLNLFALGTSRLLAVIRIVAVQGALLGALPLLIHDRPSLSVAAAALAAVALKGFAVPSIMMRALRDAQIKREVEPLIGLLPSIVLGALATALALLFSGQLQLSDSRTSALIVPASISTAVVGFLLLTTRYTAINQAVGYLVLENGIFIFGMLLVEAIPLVVEMGMLLDLLVGVFVIAIIANHINRAFSSMDTRRLASLKE